MAFVTNVIDLVKGLNLYGQAGVDLLAVWNFRHLIKQPHQLDDGDNIRMQ